MRELLYEILSAMGRNKLRTFLTGFSVAWGIFMLVVLLGAGNGLRNGVMSNFEDMAKNSVSINSGRTSMPYGGYNSGRVIKLQDSDIERLGDNIPQISVIGGIVTQGIKSISYGKNYIKANLHGASPLAQQTNAIKIVEGRFLSDRDEAESRKVIVLDENASQALSPKGDIVGQRVVVDNVSYVVIGIYKSSYMGNTSTLYIPKSLAQRLYASNHQVASLKFLVEGVETTAQDEALEASVKANLAIAHNFNPNDRRALWYNSMSKQFKETMLVFGGINIFIWIIGLGTLFSGIVGVSNIMLVIVRERTAEFGIRKSLGATPVSLVKLVIIESLIITSLFGYIGMVAGVGVMEVVNTYIEQMPVDPTSASETIFQNPTLELSIIFSATLVLIISGVIAGFVPARRAVRLKTIDAMRYNK